MGPGRGQAILIFDSSAKEAASPGMLPKWYGRIMPWTLQIAHEGECHLLTKVVFMQPFRCGVNNVDDRMLALPIANSVNLVV